MLKNPAPRLNGECMDSEELSGWREEIDSIDLEILRLLEKRFELAGEIGKVKKKSGMPIESKKREQEMMEKLTKESKLPKAFIEELFKPIFNESKRIQNILN